MSSQKNTSGEEKNIYTLQNLLSEFGQDMESYKSKTLIDKDDDDEHDELYDSDWPNPGDVIVPPNAYKEQVLATIDVFIYSAEELLKYGIESLDKNDIDAVISYLGCISVNLDDADTMLSDLGNYSGDNQNSSEEYGEIISHLLERFYIIENSIQDFHQDLVNKLSLEHYYNDHTYDLGKVMTIRSNINFDGMRYCAKNIKDSTTKYKYAYLYLFCDLYHNIRIYKYHVSENHLYSDEILERLYEQSTYFYHEILNKYSCDFEIELSSSLKESEYIDESILEQVKRIIIDPVKNKYGVFESDAISYNIDGQQIRLFCTYIAYMFQYKRVVQLANDPFPKTYPSFLAYRQLRNLAYNIEHPMPDFNTIVKRTAIIYSELAEKGLHCLSEEGIQTIYETCNQARVGDNFFLDLISYITDFNKDLTNHLISLVNEFEPISYERAKVVIEAGRKVGLDNYTLEKLAYAMNLGDVGKLRIKRNILSEKNRKYIVRSLINSGIDKEFIPEIEEFVLNV